VGHANGVRVVLLRHGIAQDRADPACPPDPLRKLTDEGKRKTRKVCRALFEHLDVKPTRILSSTLVRAQETAIIAADEMELETKDIVSTEALLPEAPPYAIFHALFAFHETDEEILVAGHAPNLDLVLALAITGGRAAVTKLKKAGAACLVLDDLPHPKGELAWLVTPKLMAALA
jgi:phosphohistidine phosphatase SixA